MAELSAAEKAAGLASISKSVAGRGNGNAVATAESSMDSLIMWIGSVADAFTPWGTQTKRRDRELRDFVPTENFLSAALAITAARNAAFHWKLEGPPRTVKHAQEVLTSAHFGRGWQYFISRLSHDLYSQDSGAFVEIIRREDSESAPVDMIANLDAARCYPTGDPEVPVVYKGLDNKNHELKYYQVVQLLEMPSARQYEARGPLYAIQMCAVSRVLKAAQILRNIGIYKEEKTGGRFQRALHLIQGVSVKQVEDAMKIASEQADNQGLMRYSQPVMMSPSNPDVQVSHDTIELATIPDGFNEADTMKHYITALAMAFLTDYQEFAPLPGGNLGTSQQAEILHMKSRGKGPAIFQGLITNLINFQGVVPQNVVFKWAEQDIEADKAMAEVKKIRADTVVALVGGGVLSPEAGRQVMLDSGDINIDLFRAMGGTDVTGDVSAQSESRIELTEPIVAPAQLPVPSAPPAQPTPPQAAAKADQPAEREELDALSDNVEKILKKVSGRVGKNLDLN